MSRHSHPSWPKPAPYLARGKDTYQRWHEIAYGAEVFGDERALLALAMEIDPEAWTIDMPAHWKRRLPSLCAAQRAADLRCSSEQAAEQLEATIAEPVIPNPAPAIDPSAGWRIATAAARILSSIHGLTAFSHGVRT